MAGPRDLATDSASARFRLATLALEDAVLGHSPDRAEAVSQAADALPPRLREPAGAFVTLKRQGALPRIGPGPAFATLMQCAGAPPVGAPWQPRPVRQHPRDLGVR